MSAGRPTMVLRLSDVDGDAVTVSAPEDGPAAGGAPSPWPKVGPDGNGALTLDVTLGGWSGPLDGLELRVHLESLVDAQGADGVTVLAPTGWSAAMADDQPGDPVVLLRPDRPLMVDGTPTTVTFGLAGIHPTATDASTGVVRVYGRGLPDDLEGIAIDLPVRVVGGPPPTPAASWVLPTTGRVLISHDPARPVLNELRLAVRNPDRSRPLVEPDQAWGDDPPLIQLSFNHAEAPPGYGRLCTTGYIAGSPPDVQVTGADDGQWLPVERVGESERPVWNLQPDPANHAVLGPGGSVQVVFSGVVSDLPLDRAGDPDPTMLSVRWANLPGQPPGSVALPLTKTDAIEIDLVADPPDVSFGATSTLSWHGTEGAEYALEWLADGEIQRAADLPAVGSRTVAGLTADTTFTLLVRATVRGVPVRAQRQVTVRVDVPSPVVRRFTARPAWVPPGWVVGGTGPKTPITLSWEVEHAAEVYLTPEVEFLDASSARARPARSTSFVLHAEGLSGAADASARVTAHVVVYTVGATKQLFRPPAADPEGSASGLAISADGTRLYLGDSHPAAALVVDTGQHEVQVRLPLPHLPSEMVASPEGAWVYSVGLGSSRLVLLDPVFSRLFSELIPRPTGLQKGNPLGTGVGVTGDGTRVWVYVSQFDGGWLTAVDPAKVRPGADGAGVVDQFNVGGQIKGMVVSPDGSRLHLARSTPSQGEVVTYDSVTHQPAVITALDSRPGWPTVMALSPDGRTVYLPTGDDSDRLTVIDTASGGVRCTIPLGAGVRAGPVQVSPDGRWVYVGCAGSRPFLGVIDVPTSELVASIPIALDPSAIAIPADGTRIYVRSSTGTLSVVTMVE